MKNRCLNCQSENLIEGVYVIDYVDPNRSKALRLETYEKPMARMFRGVHSASMHANVCRDCNFVMLFTNPNGVQELDAARKNAD